MGDSPLSKLIAEAAKNRKRGMMRLAESEAEPAPAEESPAPLDLVREKDRERLKARKAQQVTPQVGDQVGCDVRRQVGDQVGGVVGGVVGRIVGGDVGEQVGQPTDVGRYVGGVVGGDIQPDVGGDVGGKVGHIVGGDVGGDIPNFITDNGTKLSPTRAAVLDYLQRLGSHITSRARIAADLRMPVTTVRDVLDYLEVRGDIAKAREKQGMRIIVRHPTLPPTQHPTSRPTPTSDPPPLLDREIKKMNLSISQEELEMLWPRLASSGFGLPQIEQILAVGKDSIELREDLDKAEFELEHGLMVDKSGNPVSDPASWVFVSLRGGRMYRKPKGYVSEAERLVKERLDDLARIMEMEKQTEIMAMRIWRERLTPEERLVLAGGRKIPDNDEAWLPLWKLQGQPGLK